MCVERGGWPSPSRKPFRSGFTLLLHQLCIFQPSSLNPGALHPPEVLASLGGFEKTPMPRPSQSTGQGGVRTWELLSLAPR